MKKLAAIAGVLFLLAAVVLTTCTHDPPKCDSLFATKGSPPDCEQQLKDKE